MIVGQTTSVINNEYITRELLEVPYSSYILPSDISYGSFPSITSVEEDDIIIINGEMMLVAYSANNNLYIKERGYLNTPIKEHSANSIINVKNKINVNQYDNLNIYDISVNDEGIVFVDSGEPEIIRGTKVIAQDIKFMLENIGNEILNKSNIIELDSLESLQQLYNLNLPLTSSASSITLTNIEQSGTNSISVSVEAVIDGRTYNNINFFLPVKMRI